MRKRQADGSTTELSSLARPGEVVGEISFLLGTTPVISVHAQPAPHGAAITPCKVCYLDYSSVMDLVRSQPRVMKRFFWHQWRDVVHEPVPERYARLPQYADGYWSKVRARK